MSKREEYLRKSETVSVMLAGGMGSRISHLLDNIPKPMFRISGKPFLFWLIKYYLEEGLSDFVISAGYKANVIDDYFRHCNELPAKPHIVKETRPLGTAGGLLNAVDMYSNIRVPNNWFISNADSFIPVDIEALSSELREPSIDGVIVGILVSNSDRYGTMVIDENNLLLDFSEKKGGKGLVNAGIYYFKHHIFEKVERSVPQSIEKDLIPHLLRSGYRIKVCQVDAPFLDIGTPETLGLAAEFVEATIIRRGV